MDFNWKNCLKIGITLFILYLATHYWDAFIQLIQVFIGACFPLIIGGIIAYLINILMSFYEKYYSMYISRSFLLKNKRGICLIGALITLIGIVWFITILIIPELISCIQVLTNQIPPFLNNVFHYLNHNASIASLIPKNLESTLTGMNWQDMISKLIKILTSGISDVVGTLAYALSSVFSIAMTSLISFIFAIYLLLDKEKLSHQCHRLMNTYVQHNINQKIFYVIHLLNDSFHKFIVGQCIEAIILGALCILGMFILRLPYAVMIGTFIGFTALIPVAGAYIGGAVGVFMILTVSPVQSIVFLIFLCLLQQFEENLIYPRVVGASIGLSALWVLAAITIGGGVFGIIGMLIGVPIAATIYTIIKDDMKNKEESNVENISI